MKASQFEEKYGSNTIDKLTNLTHTLFRVLDMPIGVWEVKYARADRMLESNSKQNRILNEEKEQDVRFNK